MIEYKQTHKQPGSPSVFKRLSENPILLMVAFFSSIGGFLFGYDQGVISSIQEMESFRARFPMTSTENGLVVSILELGAWLGSYFIGAIADKISRKYSILVALVIFLIGSALQTGAQQVLHLILGRFIGGVGIGSLSLLGPLPRWLMQAGREKDAHLVLVRLRGHVDVDSEWKEIKAMTVFERQIEEQQFLKFKIKEELANRSHLQSAKLWCQKEYLRYSNVLRQGMWKRVLVGSTIMFFQQMMGINAVIYYAPFIINGVGITGSSVKLLATGVIGVVMVLCCIPTVLLLDRLGRRWVLLFGGTIITLSMLTVGIFSTLFSQTWPQHMTEGWACVAIIYVYCGIFAFSWGPVAWLIPSEIFPLRVRAKAMAITSSSHWMNNFIIGFITPSLLERSPSAMYYMFAGFGVTAVAFVYFFLPETKGASLEEIDLLLGGGMAREDDELLEQIRRQIDDLEIAQGSSKA
ncbi:general substrate transporter [Hesseltinella vesiculosa]|uniref:General substrate transporter n=1 Tax=Hesseltinella vesiculosa TaxID=101127 RepID=A0A1X2GGJ9_9FUNG|nr:general substrate transporter [Hesseltinella vesiculosa]